MHKIIHPKFELDLTPYKITFVEENHWFSDVFFTKYSFPFDIYLIESLVKVFGELLDDNTINEETYFDVIYTNGNKIESAILEVETQQGMIINVTIRYGFDELPNWDKNLNELPLDIIDVTDIYQHAKTVIGKTWPEVNYNFPQIHTDKYDTTDEVWETFKMIINNYDGTNFLENTFSTEDFANRNIIQPCPSFLHILTVLFADAGYTLKGNILEDEIFKKLLMFINTDFYDVVNNEEIPIKIGFKDYTYKDQFKSGYSESVTLAASTKYKISGMFNFNSGGSSVVVSEYISINYNGSVLYNRNNTTHPGVTGIIGYPFSFTFDTSADETASHTLTFGSSSNLIKDIDNSTQIVFNVIIEKLNLDGTSAVDEIHVKNYIDLKELMPDITCGTFITELKNYFNIDLDIVGKDIYMNFIEDEINYNNAEDLSLYEELEPLKQRNNNMSFLLQFADVDNDDYSYDPVFQNKKTIAYNEDSVDDDTSTITINIAPLPIDSREGIDTAYAFEEGSTSKMYAVLYSGLNSNGLNLTDNDFLLLLPNIHEKYHKKWFTFRINAITFSWTFKMFIEQLNAINKKIYAYKRYHIVKSINKTQIAEDLYEVDIETDTLP